MDAFHRLGGRVTKAVRSADVFVVQAGPVKETTKLVAAVALGKDIATESWVIESGRKGRFLDLREFLPKDDKREREWQLDL